MMYTFCLTTGSLQSSRVAGRVYWHKNIKLPRCNIYNAEHKHKHKSGYNCTDRWKIRILATA